MLSLDYIRNQAQELQAAGIENAKNEIIWFLEHNKIISKRDLFVHKEKILSVDIKKSVDKFVFQRKQNKPFQYIMNTCDFFGENFIIDNRALIPRPETETIIHYLQNKSQYIDVLEIGTGSGVISCLLSLKDIGKNILATDISYSALELAQQNIDNHQLDNIRLIYHDILQQSFRKKFDLIISNPPYISLAEYQYLPKEIKDYEPASALTDGSDGLIFYRRFSTIIKNILKPNGVAYCEIGQQSTCLAIENIFKANYKIQWINDLNKDPRFVEIRLL